MKRTEIFMCLRRDEGGICRYSVGRVGSISPFKLVTCVSVHCLWPVRIPITPNLRVFWPRFPQLRYVLLFEIMYHVPMYFHEAMGVLPQGNEGRYKTTSCILDWKTLHEQSTAYC